MKWVARLLLMLLLFSGCSQQEAAKKNLFAMDTYMELTAYGPQAGKALDLASQELLRLEQQLDRKGEGEIAQINSEGSGVLSEDGKIVLEQSLLLAEQTDGAFDPTVTAFMDVWGFYDNQPQVPEEAELASALEQVGYYKVELEGNFVRTNGTKLDFGGIAKGYAGDQVCQILRDAGVSSALISLGGNVQAVGRKPDGSLWNVAVADPEDPNNFACSLAIENKAVVTSGGYQRNLVCNGVEYHHILDPRTGFPANTGLLSVTVVGDCGMVCDGLSTALYVMGLEQGLSYWRRYGGFEAIFITKDVLYYTPGLHPGDTGGRQTVCLQ